VIGKIRGIPPRRHVGALWRAKGRGEIIHRRYWTRDKRKKDADAGFFAPLRMTGKKE